MQQRPRDVQASRTADHAKTGAGALLQWRLLVALQRAASTGPVINESVWYVFLIFLKIGHAQSRSHHNFRVKDEVMEEVGESPVTE